MSRICGVVRKTESQKQSEHETRRMLATMQHNAALQAWLHTFDGGALGHAPTTPQPSSHLVAHAYRNTSIVFCGYLIGWRHLVQTLSDETNSALGINHPAELVAYLLLEHGTEALARLNGIFAFAQWRPDERELVLGVDRYGMRPLFYLHQGDSVLFASEIKAICFAKGELTPDHAALEELITFGFLFGDRTFFQEIKRVPPATTLHFSQARMRSSRYWWFDQIKIDPQLEMDDYIQENQRVFRQAIARFTEEKQDHICLLSAGYDSRRILLELTMAGQATQAYTFAWGGPGMHLEIDHRIASKVCEKLGVPHETIDLPDPATMPTLVACTNIFSDFQTDENSQMIPLVAAIPPMPVYNFDGLVGGEVAKGVSHWFLSSRGQRPHPPPQLAYTLLSLGQAGENRKMAETIVGRSPYLWKQISRIKVDAPPMVERFTALLNELPDSANKEFLFFFLNRSRREIAYLPLGLLSLKAKSFLPYLDNDYFAQVLSLRPKLKIESNPHPQGLFLRATDEELMRIPTSYDLNIYDKRLPPRGYSDYYIPVGDYGDQVRRKKRSSAERDLWRSPAILAKLSWRSILKASALAIPDHLNLLPEGLAYRRYWLLQRLAHLANWHRFHTDQSWGMEQLQLARDFVYGRRSASAEIRRVM